MHLSVVLPTYALMIHVFITGYTCKYSCHENCKAVLPNHRFFDRVRPRLTKLLASISGKDYPCMMATGPPEIGTRTLCGNRFGNNRLKFRKKNNRHQFSDDVMIVHMTNILPARAATAFNMEATWTDPWPQTRGCLGDLKHPQIFGYLDLG